VQSGNFNLRAVLESWNFKCPRCGENISATDSECYNCTLNFSQFIVTETQKKFKQILDSLPLPVVYWRAWEVFYVLILYLTASLITNSVQIRYLKIESDKYFLITILLSLFNAAFLIFPTLFIILKKYKQKIKVVGVTFNKLKLSAIVFEGLKFAYFFAFFNFVALKYIFDAHTVYPDNYSLLSLLLNSKSLLNLTLSILILGIIIPFIEEVFFRGFFYKAFRPRFAFLPAALFSSLIFGALHIEPSMIPFGIISGMVLCFLYEKYQSIMPGFIMHSVINICFILFAFNNGHFIRDTNWLTVTLAVIIVSMAFALVNYMRAVRLKIYRFGVYNLFVIFFILILGAGIIAFSGKFPLINKTIISLKSFLLINQSQFKRAEQLINEALTNDSENTDLQIILQTIYYYDGDHQKSYKIGKKILDKLSESERNFKNELYLSALVNLSLSAIEINEDYSKEFGILKKYLETSEDIKPEILETIGWLYIQKQNFAVGEELIRKYFDEKQSFSELEIAEVNYHLGYMYYKKLEYSNALVYFKKSAKFGKTNYFSIKSDNYIQLLAQRAAV